MVIADVKGALYCARCGRFIAFLCGTEDNHNYLCQTCKKEVG